MMTIRGSRALSAALLLAALLPAGAKADEVDRMTTQLKNCESGSNSVDNSKDRADMWKDYLKKKTIPNLKESTYNAETYAAALAQYNDVKKKKYPPNKDARFRGLLTDKLDDCLGAHDGFKTYYTDMDIDNQEAYRLWEASKKKVSDAEAQTKTALDACIVQLRAKIESNNRLNEASKNIFKTKTGLLTSVAGKNSTLSHYIKTYLTTYTDANLADCQKYAADKTVENEYSKYSGQRAEQSEKDRAADVAAAKAAKEKYEADQAKAKKKAEDDFKARKEAAEREHQERLKQAAARLIEAQNYNINCAKKANTRMGELGKRYSAMMKAGAVSEADLPVWKKKLDEINGPLGKIIAKTTDDVACDGITPLIDLYEKFVAAAEAKNQAMIAAAKKEQDDKQAKAKLERERWEAEHPTYIPDSCKATCKVRHAGTGPKYDECTRQCAITAKALKDVANFIADETVVKGMNAALGKLGASKAACELAKSKAGELLAKANAPLDSLAGKVKEKSEAACVAAHGSAKKCKFVAKFVMTATSAKECTNASKNLQGSIDKAAKKIEDGNKLVKLNNDKKMTKESENAFKAAAKDAATGSAGACESVKASDIAANLIKPCVDAAAGAAWLLSHAGDYSDNSGATAAKAAADAKTAADAKAAAAAKAAADAKAAAAAKAAADAKAAAAAKTAADAKAAAKAASAAKEAAAVKAAAKAAATAKIDSTLAILDKLNAVVPKLGVAKNQCSASLSTAVSAQDKAIGVLRTFTDSAKNMSEATCRLMRGTEKRCTYVARMAATVKAEKECSEIVKSLKSSVDSAGSKIVAQQNLVAQKKTLLAKRKADRKAGKANAKEDQDEENSLNEALKTATKETSSCDSLSDPGAIKKTLETLVKPCVDAEAGTAWLTANPSR